MAGMSTAALAEKYKLSKLTIRQLTAGVPRPPQHFGPRTQETAERNIAMVAAYERGEENMCTLADKYGVSQQRVEQILRPTGTTALVKEQRRLQREAAQSHAAEIKAAIRNERAGILVEGVELVRQGFSINEARRQLEKKYPGVLPSGAFCIQFACKQAGVEIKHGRWRDRQPRIDRARELRAAGMSWRAIDKQVMNEGLGRILPDFVSCYMPDLIEHSKQRLNGTVTTDFAAAVSSPPAEPRPKKVWVDPESIWTDEVVARLKTMWFNGSTAQQCSDILGPPFTRNAILGKINRLRSKGQLLP